MSILRHVVIATSTALVASSVLASAATAAPAPATAAPAAEPAIDSTPIPSLLKNITASSAVAELPPARSAEALEIQIVQVDTALQGAEAAALEAAENLLVAGEEAAQARNSPEALGGTSISNLSISSAELERRKSSELSATAQSLYAQTETRLRDKRAELVAASALARKTSVADEMDRLQKAAETRGEAELMNALLDSETRVADPVNDPSRDPEALDGAAIPAGSLGSATVAGAAATVPTAVSRAKRIDTSIKWAKKVASNNKYRYRYGASGPTYFDCSGFTGKAFSTGGKKLQRTSSSQYRAAPKKVKLSRMKKGDLVFWSSNGGRSFYHVAIYIGGGKIAHARNPKVGISVTKLNYAGMSNIHKYAGRY